MLDFLIRQKWTPQQVKAAATKAAEFRRNKYTSGSAHVDDLIVLRKAIVLCDSHARKFSPRAARYEQHADPKMRRVIGNCDVCNMPGLASLFISCEDALTYRKSYEKWQRDLAYSTIVTG